MSDNTKKSPLPFIRDHRLIELVKKRSDATLVEQRQWLRPETFRWRREDERFSEAPADLAESWAWEDVADRTTFLADVDPRLRVITVNAGAGKTMAALQSQYLLQQVHSDHLCILVNFSHLPTTADDIWGPTAEHSCLVRWFCENAGTKEAPRRDVAGLIGYKIRIGKLTLIVEAFDQTTSGRNTKDIASALQKFLELYPTVRCICTGRPHAIVDQCWEPLFQHDTWQFVQVEAFSKKQAEVFVGTDRWKLCQRLDATELFVPRSLEAIRNIQPIEKLKDIRTASQLYWRSLIYTLEKARDTQNPNMFRIPGESWEIKTHHALQLFALLAFECNRQGCLDGVQSGMPFRVFFDELWRRHKAYLHEEYGITSKPKLEEMFTTLARLNTAIDFAAFDHEGISQVIFQNRTLQDFLAAIWMCTHATPKDRGWFNKQKYVRWNKSTHTHYQMWKLTVEMPNEWQGQMMARFDKAYIKAVRSLFAPSTPDHSAIRSTEMIWRCWPLLAVIAKQQDATGIAAEKVLDNFCGEYPQILNGSRITAAKQICEDFETWFVTIDPNAASWKAGELDSHGKPLPIVDRRYRMAKYTLTNELFALFAPDQEERYVAKGTEWGVDFSKYVLRRRVPVVAIDWYDAWCVSKWLGSELPTEQEWEYACRAGQRTPFSVGNGNELTEVDARFGKGWKELATDVDAFAKGNAWGLYQMHGNVWEWCSSWYDGDESSRCLRGGSFVSDPGRCRSAARHGYSPASSNDRIGVRLSRAASD